ncbi:unnamed protein product [Nezara viridula]|uniref:Uncharacterized protein n=1 Tax=Nezara viridula TaxID=85310 RepID=A0A9P0E9F4_NEZVI|nr:unnamed protein product [Nezara viridula]
MDQAVYGLVSKRAREEERTPTDRLGQGDEEDLGEAAWKKVALERKEWKRIGQDWSRYKNRSEINTLQNAIGTMATTLWHQAGWKREAPEERLHRMAADARSLLGVRRLKATS